MMAGPGMEVALVDQELIEPAREHALWTRQELIEPAKEHAPWTRSSLSQRGSMPLGPGAH